MARWVAVAALLCLLAGCGTDRTSGLPLLPAPAAASVSHTRLQAAVRIEPAEITGAGFRTQAVVSPLGTADVDHMRFDLGRVEADGSETSLGEQETPAGSGTGSTVAWSHLKRNTTYVLKVYALDSANVILNANGTAAQQVVETGDDDDVAVSLAIQLADRVFAGRVHPVVTASTIPQGRVDHLAFVLESQADTGAWLELNAFSTPGGSGMSKTVDFLNLKRDTTYRLTVTAFDKKAAVLGTSSAAFTTTHDDYVSIDIAI